MADINILSPHLADLIAAGEVVERPASVIKELLENSFDAGAKSVTAEIKDGGLTLIRVTDDGCGMLPEDAGVCFLRHATSKLKDERGLERIGTMGFRGEALAAIAAVSDIELLTRKKGSPHGVRVLVNAGEIADMTPFGCPEGTSITVSGLFRNTPARLKFLKSDKSEGSACALAALRCALGRPEISVRFIRDGREEFFSPGDGRQDSCLYSLLGRELAGSMLPCSLTDERLSVSGFTGSPAAGHGSRSKQFFFCGGRCIRSALLQAAVEQAYKNTLLTGRFPACALWLDISPSAVDVNVHPAKTEIRFRDEKRVFDAVYHAVLAALEKERGLREMKLPERTSSPPKAQAAPREDFFRSMPAARLRREQSGEGASITSGAVVIDRRTAPDGKRSLKDGAAPYFTSASGDAPPPRQERIEESFVPPTPEDTSEQTEPSAEAPEFRLVGEAMKTYIIAERDGELIFIDKHAAHERMIFDRLKSQGREIMSQVLLSPVTLRVGPGDVELAEKNGELLSALGFELEPFGEDSLILRALPADTAPADAPSLVEELCEKLRSGASLSPEEASDEILHTVACKAAIKAGWNTSQEELYRVARAVISGQVKYCPHGRPVSVSLTKKQLDKEFSRIV